MNILTDLNEFKIGVVGGGSWGTALANLLASKGFKIDQWIFEEDVINEIMIFGENKRFLPGIKLSNNLKPYNSLKRVVSKKNLILVVVPSHFFRDIVTKMLPFVSLNAIILSASKGIENSTFMTMSSVLKSVMPELEDSRLAVITGPSFAKEVAEGIPTLVTVATKYYDLAKTIQSIFATDYFRVYTIDDVIGAELGAAIKNVIAIAAGVVDGLKLGFNTRAALITRGLAEIRRLGLVMGANPRTFTGLAGVGDLVLTCTSFLSRNYFIGKKIGQGKKIRDVMSNMHMVAEGVRTTESVYMLSKKLGVDMPISQSIYQILYENLSPNKALKDLMTRDLKQEFDER